MKVDVKSISGKKVGSVDLSDDVFAIEPNSAAMHQALVRQQANAVKHRQASESSVLLG